MYGIYAMAASGRMQYDYKQTNTSIDVFHGLDDRLMVVWIVVSEKIPL